MRRRTGFLFTRPLDAEATGASLEEWAKDRPSAGFESAA
jgi:hypothetical protein